MPQKIVIAGAGFGGAYTFKHLHDHFHESEDVELILVNPTNYFLFMPMLHEVATGGLSPDVVVEPLRKVLGCCLNSFYRAKVQSVDREQRIVQTDSGAISYDYLVMAVGSKTQFFNVPGAEENSFTLKSLPDALRLKNHLISTLENASHETDAQRRRDLLRYVVVGAGPTGVELAAELAELVHGTFEERFEQQHLAEEVEILLVDSGPTPLARLGEDFGSASQAALVKRGVHLLLNEQVSRVNSDSIELNSGRVLKTKTPIWVTGVTPQDVSFTPEIDRSKGGRLLTNEFLQLVGDQRIFALGDIAEQQNPATPAANYQLGQVAARQAKAVAENLTAILADGAPQPFIYNHAGDLVSLGRWSAAGKISGVFFSGRFAWWLWRTVYLSKLLSWRKKLKVMVDWTVNLFSARDTAQIG